MARISLLGPFIMYHSQFDPEWFDPPYVKVTQLCSNTRKLRTSLKLSDSTHLYLLSLTPIKNQLIPPTRADGETLYLLNCQIKLCFLYCYVLSEINGVLVLYIILPYYCMCKEGSLHGNCTVNERPLFFTAGQNLEVKRGPPFNRCVSIMVAAQS